MNLKGKNILVTGAGGDGVGKGICKILEKCGATLILNELNLDKAKMAAKKFPGSIPVEADISDEEAVFNMFSQIKQEVGVLHGLVNNAGIGLGKMAHKISVEEFKNVYSTDVKGLWLVSRIFVNQLIDTDEAGHIVNISSVHAHSTISGYAIYAGAKAAVEGLTRGLAVEYGPYGIRVNAIAPGYVHSEQNYELIKTWSDDPHQWVEEHIKDQQVLLHEIQPEDCGNVVAFLLSDLSRSVTGQTIYVDNGSTSLLYNRYSTEKK